jgi:hypothetical protein
VGDVPVSPKEAGRNSEEGIEQTRGIQGLPEVSLGPAMPHPSMPCGQATPETAIFYRVARPQYGRPAAVFYPLDTPCRTGLDYDETSKLPCLNCGLESVTFLEKLGQGLAKVPQARLMGEFHDQGDDVKK